MQGMKIKWKTLSRRQRRNKENLVIEGKDLQRGGAKAWGKENGGGSSKREKAKKEGTERKREV